MELQKSVWEGRVATCFVLAEDSISGPTSSEPTPFFIYIPRVSYLPTVFEKLRKHFEKYVKNVNEEIWCDHNNEPLKWVHFGDYPTNELLHCTSPETVESHYLSTLKEADFLVHNKRIVDQFQKRDFKQLWSSLLSEKFDQFWAINRRCHEAPTYSNEETQIAPSANDEANAGGSTEKSSLRYFAFRLYVQSATTRRTRVIQKLLKPTIEKDGKKLRTTLGDAIAVCLPDASISSSAVTDRLPFTIVIHGIEFDNLSVPFEWLAEHLSYPENFVHIAVLGYPK